MIRRLWHSPTFTSWGSKLAASARLFLVLPLLLTRFDEVQIASWFLFGSVSFLGNVITTQIAVIGSRMMAVATGGATDLLPVVAGDNTGGDGRPNWPLIERLYSSFSLINLLGAFVAAAVSCAFGLFALVPLLDKYEGDRGEIWLSFAVILLGQFIVESFRRYSIALRGLGNVALVCRWDALFSVLSAISGGVVLMLGGGVVALALVMQALVITAVVRQWFLLNWFVERRFSEMAILRVDRQIVAWLWSPLWRSVLRALSNRGGAKVGVVILARHAEPAVLTSVLLCLRLLEMLDDIAATPMISNVPGFGKLLGAGRIREFRKGVRRAFILFPVVYIIGIVAICIGGIVGLKVADANVQFLPVSTFLILSISYMLAAQIRLSLMISVVGNHVVAVRETFFSALVMAVCSLVLIPILPLYGFIISAFLPLILIVNVVPLRIGCELIDVPVLWFLKRMFFYPMLLMLLLSGLLLVVDWESRAIVAAEAIKAAWDRLLAL